MPLKPAKSLAIKLGDSGIESRNLKSERLARPEPIGARDGFESVCFDLVERLACSEPPELIELAVALEARYARAVVELGVVEFEAPDSRHNLQAVEGMAERRASGVAAQGEPVRSVEVRDESARFACRQKARGCGAGRDRGRSLGRFDYRR